MIIPNVPNHLVGEFVGNGRIELVSLIGEGAYGCVYRGVVGEGILQKQYAVKCISRLNLNAYHLMIQHREILLHQSVSDGDGIVSLYETFEEDDYLFLVMEFCTGGDLWEAIATGMYNEKDDLIRDIFTQILDAVEYCHLKRVFHRDLKPENILLVDDGRKVLLADFGLASGSVVSNEIRCGSPWYMSPECWGINTLGRPYATGPNDVWALGILFINMACGRHAPWKQATSRDLFFQDFSKQPGMLRFFLPMSSEAHDLLERVFDMDSTTRISVADFRLAVQHMKQITIPISQYQAFRDQQVAWIDAVRPTHSHPLSIDTLRLIPIASTHGRAVDEVDSIDITEYATTSYFMPFLLSSSVSPPPSNSFICDIPIMDTRPPARPLSVASSVESFGPITPDMLATPMPHDVPDIADSQDLSDALDDFTDTPTIHSKAKLPIMPQPLQNILQALSAL